MIGMRISHYEVVAEIGRGGMGVVYRARDVRLGRTVALKFLPPELTSDEVARERFVREAQAASALNHPNICTIHEIDETDQGRTFIVMACYEGESLRERLARGPLEETEAREIALQIAEGLAAAHRKGIVHRDIKPANIFLCDDGFVRILDFGLAKLTGGPQITKDSTTLGTAAYMAPERYRGETEDSRSDIWSLGVVLYQMLTGRLPFEAEYEQAMMYAVLNEEPESPSSKRPGLNPAWDAILAKCLAKELNQRYATVQELIDELRRLAGRAASRTPLQANPPVREGKRSVSSRVAGTAVVAAVVLILAFLVVWFLGRQRGGEFGERVPIAVVDFTNQTGEPELNGLSGMLITALEQSRRLKVLTRSRMFDILAQLGQDNVSKITEALGRKVCAYVGIRMLASATVHKFGNVYAIDLKVLDVPKDEYVLTAKVQGRGQECIPSLIDELSEKTRERLRERPAEIEARSVSVSRLTTPNLEAYHHFFRGEELVDRLKFKEAGREFARAIQLDSTFGLAYYRYAYAQSWLLAKEEPSLRLIEKAFALLDRIPKRQQFLVRAVYAQITQGFEAGVAVLKQMEKRYPDDKEMIYNIGDWCYHAGRYNEAETYLSRSLAMDSSNTRALQHLTWVYWETGRYEDMLRLAKTYVRWNPNLEAYGLVASAYACLRELEPGEAYFQETLRRYPDRYAARAGLADLYIYHEHFTEAEQALKPLIVPGVESHARQAGYYRLAKVHFYQGRFRDGLSDLDKLAALEREDADTTAFVGTLLLKARQAYQGWGDVGKAWQLVEPCLEFESALRNSVNPGELSILLVCRGEYERALQVSGVYGSSGTALRWRQILQFLIRASKGERASADSLGRFLLKEVHLSPAFELLVANRLGQLEFELGNLEEAAVCMRRVQELKTDTFGFRSVRYARSYYWLGRIYEAKGDLDLARENYARFLGLWHRADRDLPGLVDAKRRLARLL